MENVRAELLHADAVLVISMAKSADITVPVDDKDSGRLVFLPVAPGIHHPGQPGADDKEIVFIGVVHQLWIYLVKIAKSEGMSIV